MHGKCQTQLDDCDAATPGQLCAVTACYASCGCSHNPDGSSLACHETCMTGNTAIDNNLTGCVVSTNRLLNSPWPY